jgi:hypothetical protein
LLYFASDRFDNSGDAQQGFWFFQNSVFAAANGSFEQTNPDGSVSPAVHKVGDILIVSDFSIGGTTSTIDVYEWVGSGGDTNGTLNFLSGGVNLACNLVPAPSPLCGQVNTSPTAIITSPWPFQDKSNHTGFQQGEFYNGGINLSAFPGLARECFGSFTAETRSSTSPTATLKSFIIGNFAKCGTTTTSTPQDSSGHTIPPGGLSIGTGSVTVQDSATVTATGSTVPPTGSVDFHLCGPLATTPSTSSCAAGAGVDLTPGTPPPAPLDGVSNPSTVKSPTAVISKVGTYCFRADYSGDTNYPKSSDGNSDECFQVNPVPTTLTTTASGTVPVGSAIDDTAHLSGTANEPGTPVINPPPAGVGGPAKGTITWNLYDLTTDPNCGTSLEMSKLTPNGDGAYSASNGTLSGSLGTGPTIVPTAAGTYEWVANYSGDSPNTLASSPVNTCASPGADVGQTESVVVSPFQPMIHTNATSPPSGAGVPLGSTIDDTATLSNATAPSNGVFGTITFNLYGPSDTPVCNTAIETSVVQVTSANNGNNSYAASSGTLSGTLGTGPGIIPTAAGTYYWTAKYTPATGDVNNLSVTEGCGGTNGDPESSLVIQLQPTISTAQSFVPNDSATVTVGSNGAGPLSGTVDFKLFVNNPTCDSTVSAAAYDSLPLSITGPGTTGGLDSRTINSANATSYNTTNTTFSWLVTYVSNNPGHKGVVSNCSENSSITINN